jgi:hypothetical protein
MKRGVLLRARARAKLAQVRIGTCSIYFYDTPGSATYYLSSSSIANTSCSTLTVRGSWLVVRAPV